MSAANDSPDLEALFDSIAATAGAPKEEAPVVPVTPPPPPAKPSSIPAIGDSDELQSLFDSVATFGVATAEAAPEPVSGQAEVHHPEGWEKQEEVFNQIGQMARSLHDSLRSLGYDKLIEKTVSAIPDAKDRLAYVANLTEQAACRVLNATDIAVPVVEDIGRSSREMADRWDRLFANQLSVAEFKALAEETRGFLRDRVPGQTSQLHAQLTEIMMAQDFQDLTGQVIKKIVVLAQELETGLMKVLLQVVPETKRTEEVESLMNGPVINAEGRNDVVVNQEQVDDLLESLGF